jgi:hypothetical protein
VIWYATSMPGDAQSIQSGEIARSIESLASAPAVGMKWAIGDIKKCSKWRAPCIAEYRFAILLVGRTGGQRSA